ncbi:MAG: hypothetical protein JKY37_07290 [Nannocystaceae bacterium]|nr:hypothetical protein [Nannocystaceae bacterium]
MKIQLTSTRSRFIVGESFGVHVRLVNDGAHSVVTPDPFSAQNPQPTYSVQGPSYLLTKVTSALAGAMPGHTRPPVGAPVATVTLVPGEVLEGDVPLSSWLDLQEPGTYEIVAAVEYEGRIAISPKIVLDIDGMQAQGVSIGVDEGANFASSMTASFVQRGDVDRSIYDVVLREHDPESGRMVPEGMSHRRDLDPPADCVHVPWGNRARTEASSSWRFWVTSEAGVSKLRVADSPSGEPVNTALARDTQLLLPAFADADDTLDVPLLTDNGRVVEVARFRGGSPPRPPKAASVWRSKPTSRVLNARLALGSPAGGNARRLVALEERDGTLTVSHYWVDGPSTPTMSQPVSGGQFLSGAPMAVRVTSDGTTRCRFLLCTHGRAWRVYMASLDFDAEGKLTGPGAIETLVSRKSAMPAAAIEFPLHSRDDTDVAWVLTDYDGSYVWGRGGQKAIKGQVRAPLVMPLQLRPLALVTYLCTLQPGQLPDLVALEGGGVGGG